MATYKLNGSQFTAFLKGIKAASKKADKFESLAGTAAYQMRYYGNFDAVARVKAVIPGYAGEWFDDLEARIRADHEHHGIWKGSGITADEMDAALEAYVAIVMDAFNEREKENAAKKAADKAAAEAAKKSRCLLVRGEEEVEVTPEEMAEISKLLQKLRDGSLGIKGNVLKEGDALKVA
jgi:hypothetical protein